MAGRFIQKDPISFKGGDWNLYGYVKNNPSNRKDPSGLIDPVDIVYDYETNPTIDTTVPLEPNLSSPYEELRTIAIENLESNYLVDLAKDKAKDKAKDIVEDLIKKGLKRTPTVIQGCGK